MHFFALDEDTLTSQGLKEPSVSNINKNMLRYLYVQQKNRMDSNMAHGLVAERASYGVDHHLGA